MKIKQKKIEEEGDADDQCSADILLRGVIITVWCVESVWISELLLFQGLLLLCFKPETKEKGFEILFMVLCLFKNENEKKTKFDFLGELFAEKIRIFNFCLLFSSGSVSRFSGCRMLLSWRMNIWFL